MIDGVKEGRLLHGVFDVGINEEGVRLCMYVLYSDLKSVETAGLWDLGMSADVINQIVIRCSHLNLRHETPSKVLVDDPI